jgi:class I lanthipeptide synthase
VTAGQSLSQGAAGLALRHLEAGHWEQAGALLRQAVADGVSVANTASLYYGVPALAFVLAATDRPELATARAAATDATAALARRRLHTAHQRIDRGQRPPLAEYDLVRGLTGLGVLARRVGDLDTLRDVLAYLVRLTEPIGGLPGWWCPHGPSYDQPGPPGGHSNHGIAHGITAGPLALLAHARRDGTLVDDQDQAILRICTWLDHWRQHSHGGGWWPQTVTAEELHIGQSAPTRSAPAVLVLRHARHRPRPATGRTGAA